MRDDRSPMQTFFEEGHTKPYAFRKQQLLALRSAILLRQHDIEKALYQDLGKSAEESWVTETGFILSEISHTLRHLKKWMRPERRGTNLLNFPSKSYVVHEPLGLALIIAPWNYPVQLLLTPLVGAIAGGNCAVVKPSELAPASSALIAKMIAETFPENYIRCVEGEGAVVISELLSHEKFQHLFYTGSTATGRKIYEMAASQLIPVTLELGGKSPCVIEADADLRVAARRIAVTKFSNAGQMCVAPDYLLVHESVKESFVQQLIACIQAFYPQSESNGKAPGYARIINKNHHARLLAYLAQGKIIFGGRTDTEKNHFEPTLIEPYKLDSPLMQEEIFGPILPIISFREFEEARNIISQNPNPLAFYVFSQNKTVQEKWMDAVPAGGGCINNISWHLTNFNLPFGGRGQSGTGAYHGKYSFNTFTHAKAVMKTPTWFDPALKYPPFEGKLGLFKRFIR